MLTNQISAFEYVSILVSIILGLGITQILSSFSDLLYHYKTVKFYWPHTLWILFILFLHIQDWFITYQLKDKPVWNLPELLFVLLYPITLFISAKILLPTNEKEEKISMKIYYLSQYPILFFIVGISVFISIIFNIFLLKIGIQQQAVLLVFLSAMIYLSLKRVENGLVHKAVAVAISIGSIISVIIERDSWIIK